MRDVAIANIPYGTIGITRRDQRNKVEHLTLALMSYLSAIECATAQMLIMKHVKNVVLLFIK